MLNPFLAMIDEKFDSTLKSVLSMQDETASLTEHKDWKRGGNQ